MADALSKDLPRDLPSFPERFGTDAQCRRAFWPAPQPAPWLVPAPASGPVVFACRLVASNASTSAKR